jgi:RimJ/RimL family protein N-acetyltransferase
MFKNEKLLISNENNFYLKQLSKIDVTQSYINWLNDYEVVKFTEQRHLKHSNVSVCQFVEQKKSSKENYLFGIYYDKKHIGNVKLGPISFSNKRSEISYIIGEKQYWGRGLATQTINFLSQIAKDKLNIVKLLAGTYDCNLASINVLKKNGFKLEGRITKSVYFEKKQIDNLIFGKVLID